MEALDTVLGSLRGLNARESATLFYNLIPSYEIKCFYIS